MRRQWRKNNRKSPGGRRPTRGGGQTAPQVATYEKTLTIGRFGHHGAGIAELEDGTRVFVPYTLPGEKVVARITGDRARPTEIVTSSADRIDPECRHYTVCGGCTVQHADAQFVRDWKRQIVVTALENRKINTPVADVIDAHGAGRRRVSLHVRQNGSIYQAGFMRARSHGLEVIESCPVLCAELAKAPEIAIAVATMLKAYGSAFEVAMTATDHGLDVAVSGRGFAEGLENLELRQALAELAAELDLARLTLGGETLAARRAATLTMGPAQVELPVNAFSQSTALGEITLAERVVAAVSGASRIADLFAGLGPFALRLGSSATVHAIDTDAAALRALSQAANEIGIRSTTTEIRDLFRRPLLAPDLEPYDAVILDPPRAGAEAQAEALATSRVPIVASVSCNPVSFARDAACLIAGGYSLQEVTPVDQFKWSSHIEIVGVFTR